VLAQQVEGVLAGSCPAFSTAEVARQEVSHLQHSTLQQMISRLCSAGMPSTGFT
jgi:hypothetical protein